MGMKRIMLACAAGMSTSMLVARMQKAAQEKGLDTEIFAVPASEARSRIEQEPVDVLLLGPQVMYMEAEFKKNPSPLLRRSDETVQLHYLLCQIFKSNSCHQMILPMYHKQGNLRGIAIGFLRKHIGLSVMCAEK